MKIQGIFGIISLILESADQGSSKNKAKIMYKTILANPELKDVVTILTAHGFLSYDDTSQTFRTTEKGLQFLDKYNQAVREIEEKNQLHHHCLQQKRNKDDNNAK